MVSDRIYQIDGNEWYFTVRGNQAMGPYATYHEADAALDAYVDRYRSRIEGRSRGRRWPRSLQPSRLLRRSAPRHT